MTTRQKQIIYSAIFLLTLFVLFPPWNYENSHTSVEYSAGYHFLLSPPKVKSDTEMRKQLSIPDDVLTSFIVKRDIPQFIAQILALPFLTIGFLLILADKKSLEKTVIGSVSIFVGSLFIALVCLMSWK